MLQALRALHALGVRIAMDDFGTGYSSLAYLWRFPFDKLKIDRAFTQGLGGDGKVDAIVHSIVTLAHSLAIRVNAEGVETDSTAPGLVPARLRRTAGLPARPAAAAGAPAAPQPPGGATAALACAHRAGRRRGVNLAARREPVQVRPACS